MQDLRELKPILTALVLPPAGPLLLALLGLVLARWRRGAGHLLVLAGLAATFLLSTNGMALVLARQLPALAPAQSRDVERVQAIVVLGGGVVPDAPEYGSAQPGPNTLSRLRYGAALARRTGKPIAFSGGIGWGGVGIETEAEGAVAARVLQQDYGLALRWVDDRSRDTAENAQRMAAILLPQGIRHVALVTDWAHMSRAAAAFRGAGLEVVAAPTDFPVARARPVLEWLPSTTGIASCRELVREWLGRLVARAS